MLIIIKTKSNILSMSQQKKKTKKKEMDRVDESCKMGRGDGV